MKRTIAIILAYPYNFWSYFFIYNKEVKFEWVLNLYVIIMVVRLYLIYVEKYKIINS